MSLPLPESLFLIKGIVDFFWSILHPFHVFPPSGPQWLSLFSPRSLPFPLALKSLLPLAFPTKSPVQLGTLHRTRHAAVSGLTCAPFSSNTHLNGHQHSSLLLIISNRTFMAAECVGLEYEFPSSTLPVLIILPGAHSSSTGVPRRHWVLHPR